MTGAVPRFSACGAAGDDNVAGESLQGSAARAVLEKVITQGFHSHGGNRIAGWFIVENTMKMDDDFGGPLFQETSICSMVLVYFPTRLGDFVRANVGRYSMGKKSKSL